MKYRRNIMNENVNSIKPPGDSISRSDAKDKAKEIMYSILDDTDYNDIESMVHACLMMKIKILKMFDDLPAASVSREEYEELYCKAKEINEMANDILANFPSYQEVVSVMKRIEWYSRSERKGDREDFEPVDNKLYLNPVCRTCKHSGYCNNIPIDENNEDIEYYDIYGRPVLSIRECKNYEPESN